MDSDDLTTIDRLREKLDEALAEILHAQEDGGADLQSQGAAIGKAEMFARRAIVELEAAQSNIKRRLLRRPKPKAAKAEL